MYPCKKDRSIDKEVCINRMNRNYTLFSTEFKSYQSGGHWFKPFTQSAVAVFYRCRHCYIFE
jgi:hypothetical protein